MSQGPGVPCCGIRVFSAAMALPITGSASLLDWLSPYVPDELILEVLPRRRGQGRRSDWNAAQLYRTLLLLLLTPVRSSNLLCELLAEQKAWRRFAGFANQQRLPGARQLHEFRTRLTPGVLRRINEALVEIILAGFSAEQPAVGLIDSTDLPAATHAYKKNRLENFLRAMLPSGRARLSRGRADGLSATKSTPCGFGLRSMKKLYCSSRW
jgi:transposase-like protein DUF772